VVQKTVVQSLTSGLSVALNQGRRLALCLLLLEVGSGDPSTVSFIGIFMLQALIHVAAIVGKKFTL